MHKGFADLCRQPGRFGLSLPGSANIEVDAIIQLKDERWAAVEIKMGAGEIGTAAENLIKFSENVDTVKTPPPSFLMVLTGTKYAFQMKNGVWVVPIGCLRD